MIEYETQITVWLVLLQLLPWILSLLLFGFVTRALARKKGYFQTRYFWMGFFLSIVGFLYVGFLPEAFSQSVAKLKEALKAAKDDMPLLPEREQERI